MGTFQLCKKTATNIQKTPKQVSRVQFNIVLFSPFAIGQCMGGGIKQKINTFLLYLQFFQKIRKIILKISQVCGRTQFWKSNKSPKSKWEFMKSVQLLLSSLPISNEEEIQKFKSVTAWSDLVFKTAKKNQFKATTTIHFMRLLQLATGIFMCIRRSFSVCIQ